jgi:ferredoxin-NADP reductase
MSMLRQAAQDRSPQPLLLVYSNRHLEDAAFLGELQELERKKSSFRLFATMTDMSKSSRNWDGETGFVDADLIRSPPAGSPHRRTTSSARRR